jgi:quercetin dioxygenase-like cupin family protein
MPITRREICRLLPELLPMVELPAFAAPGEPLPSATFEFGKLPVEERDHAEGRSIMKGKLVTGESVEVHESRLPPNGFPHAPHHHAHSEMGLIREGTLQLTINGTPPVLGPGGLGFVRSNEEHGIRVGTTTANYYVVAIGPGADTKA